MGIVNGIYTALVSAFWGVVNLPWTIANGLVGQLLDTPYVDAAPIAAMLDWLTTINYYVPIAEAFGLLSALWSFRFTWSSIRFVMKSLPFIG